MRVFRLNGKDWAAIETKNDNGGKMMQYQFKKRLVSTLVMYRYVEIGSDDVKDGETRLEKLYTDESAAKAALRKINPEITVLKIVSMEPITETYGLTRDELRQYGHKI